jgi:proteasome lid subunit RPN8/RPN11
VLTEYAIAGLDDGGHEGMVFWAGRTVGSTTILFQMIAPETEHDALRVHASPKAVGMAARAARGANAGILCQVHSHPGTDCRHSDGDDDLVLMPFEGMISVVVPRFGTRFESLNACGIHQFQQGRWIQCEKDSILRNFRVVPPEVDLRERL